MARLLRSRRAATLLSITAIGVTAAPAAPAQAQLGSLLPNLGTIVNDTGETLGGLLPGLGGAVTEVTGDVGGAIGGIQDSVTGTVDATLGGVLGGDVSLLPDDVLNLLLNTLLANSSAAPGTPGTGGPDAGGPIVISGGTVGPDGVVIDASAPRTTVKVLSKLPAIGRSGKMRIQISSDEPGIVALTSRIRPGAKAKKTARAHSRRVIKIPALTLAYRRAGKLVVTVRVSRAAQRALGASKDARMTVATVASDLRKNQASEDLKVKIKRR